MRFTILKGKLWVVREEHIFHLQILPSSLLSIYINIEIFTTAQIDLSKNSQLNFSIIILLPWLRSKTLFYLILFSFLQFQYERKIFTAYMWFDSNKPKFVWLPSSLLMLPHLVFFYKELSVQKLVPRIRHTRKAPMAAVLEF